MATTTGTSKTRSGIPRETSDPQSDRNGTVERALDILSLFAHSDQGSLGVTQIAEALSLSKAVVHRILATFRGRGFLELEPLTHRYRLGREFLFVGLTYLDRIDMRTLGRETLTALVARTNETATLSVRVGWSRVYLDQVTPKRDVKMVVELGRAFPLHAGASSKALLAFLSSSEQDHYLTEEPLEALTNSTVTSRRQLRSDLAQIRRSGYAVSLGERDASAGSVAAPVFAEDDSPVGAISVSGPIERFRHEADACAKAVVTAADELSRRLGQRSAGY